MTRTSIAAIVVASGLVLGVCTVVWRAVQPRPAEKTYPFVCTIEDARALADALPEQPKDCNVFLSSVSLPTVDLSNAVTISFSSGRNLVMDANWFSTVPVRTGVDVMSVLSATQIPVELRIILIERIVNGDAHAGN
jgi:hypothetical protein